MARGEMTKLTVAFLLCLLLLFNCQSAMAKNSCGVLFFNSEQTQIKKFDKFEELGEYVDYLLLDKSTPNVTKKLLNWFIESPFIRLDYISNYKSESEVTHLLSEGKVVAFKKTTFSKIRLSEFNVEEGMANNGNVIVGNFRKQEAKDDKPIQSTIYLSKDYRGSIRELFSYFIHELAHVKIDTFLNKYLYRYDGKLGYKSASENDGLHRMPVELFDYLTERYAYQKEFEITSKTLGENYFYDGLTINNKSYRKYIEMHVQKSLQDNIPDISNKFKSLSDKKLYDILIQYTKDK